MARKPGWLVGPALPHREGGGWAWLYLSGAAGAKSGQPPKKRNDQTLLSKKHLTTQKSPESPQTTAFDHWKPTVCPELPAGPSKKKGWVVWADWAN